MEEVCGVLFREQDIGLEEVVVQVDSVACVVFNVSFNWSNVAIQLLDCFFSLFCGCLVLVLFVGVRFLRYRFIGDSGLELMAMGGL